MNDRIDRSLAEGEEEPEGAAQEQVRVVSERAAELETPEVQQKINHPEELSYRLTLARDVTHERTRKRKGKTVTERIIEAEPYEREIKVRMAFTPNDIQKRGLLDMIESHYKMVQAEIANLMGIRDASLMDVLDRQPGYAEAAFSMPNCRNLARRILVSMAYADDGKPVPFHEVSIGLDPDDLTGFQLQIIYRLFELLLQAKKTKVQLASARQTFTASSSSDTAGPKTTSKSK